MNDEMVMKRRGGTKSKIVVLAIQTVMPVGYTILLLSAKQGREINAMRRVVSENVSKELSVINSLGMRRSLFAN
jgi:hypothetical protein